MRKLAAIVFLSLSLSACAQDDQRGVFVVSPREPRPAPGPFNRQESTALFVGVRDFPEGTVGQVRYTVDDAVDLAYVMAFEKKVRLVPPERVVLAISGEPVKEESRHRLEALRQARATITTADRKTITTQLERQAEQAGDGVLLLFFATHGFSSDGVGYVLASDSIFKDTDSSISTAAVFDTAARAARSIIFVDACRERVPANIRGGGSSTYFEPGGTAPLIEAMSPLNGQVVFYAATQGGYAFEDENEKNGVFTSAIIDALTGCNGPRHRGMIDADALGQQIEEQVRSWIRRRRDRKIRKATQVLMDVDTKSMTLAVCTPPPIIHRVDITATSITAFAKDDTPLWRHSLARRVTAQRLLDLDDDGAPEVIIGDDSGTVSLYTPDGELAWAKKTAADMPVERLAIDYLFAKKAHRHIVALSNAADGSASQLTFFTSDGTSIVAYPHQGRLVEVAIDRETARHAPRIIVTGKSNVLVLDRKGTRQWHAGLYPPQQTIERLRITNVNRDRDRDIEIRTNRGTLNVTFDGKLIKTTGPALVK